jgi:hypothetical protein
MPIYTRKVNGSQGAIPGRSTTSLTPTGGTIPGVLIDGSDATYAREAASGLPADLTTPDFGTPPPAAPPAERVVSVCPYVRSKQPGAKVVTVTVGGASYLPSVRITEGVTLSLPVSTSAIALYQVPAQLGQLEDPLYTDAEWAAGPNWPTLSLRDPNTAANRAYIYEAGVYAYTVTPVTVGVPNSPSGTVTTTQRPTLTTTLAHIVESWQLLAGGTEFCTGGIVEMAIYRYSDVGGASSPPAGTTPVWTQQFPYTIDQYTDGVTASQISFSQRCPVSLPNDTYVLYVHAVRSGTSAAKDQSVLYGAAYQRVQWTQNVAGPAAPTVQLTQDTANQLVAVVATGQAVSGCDSTTAQMDVQRLVGSVWREVRGMTGVGVTVGSPTALGNDLECDRGVTNTYRVRFHMVFTADGTVVNSPWTQATVAGPGVTGTGWNLKAVDLPASSWLNAPVLSEPVEQLQSQETVFVPLDRDLPVVVRGSIGGAGGTLDFIAQGSAAVAAVEALLAYGGKIFLETAFGDFKWFAVTDCTWKRQGTVTVPRRIGTITYTEVGSGLGTSSV